MKLLNSSVKNLMVAIENSPTPQQIMALELIPGSPKFLAWYSVQPVAVSWFDVGFEMSWKLFDFPVLN